MKILLTGVAGFIGFAVAKRLLANGARVLGVDNLNDYYDVGLKRDRLKSLLDSPSFRFEKIDLTDREAGERAFADFGPNRVVHLAAQAGVRYSLSNPFAYADANLSAFLNVIEWCRRLRVEHLVFASSSSVYGANGTLPFSTHDSVNHPLSLYAATKRANELMAHAYSHLYRLPTTGLRLFSAYGPWGRPDMALSIFAERILAGRPIEVFNYGNHRRDFTYVDDVAEAVALASERPPIPDPQWSATSPDPATSSSPFRIYNVGNHRPIALEYLIDLLEGALDRKAVRAYRPMADGDVPESIADIEDLSRDFGFQPKIGIEEGVRRFANWYLEYYGTARRADRFARDSSASSLALS